ncbi:MAG: glycosyltransferase 87 family protein [Nitriliruptorales bacterium]
MGDTGGARDRGAGTTTSGETSATTAVGQSAIVALMRRLPGAVPWFALGALVITLTLSYLVKAVCLEGEVYDRLAAILGGQGFWDNTRYCYSDVHVLWFWRGFDVDAVPYAPLPADYATDRTFEYPPGIAFPAWLIARVTSSRAAFFNVHALTFAVAAFVTLLALAHVLRVAGRSQRRLLGYALSPGLVLLGMQNWDLWPVALAAAGLMAASRGRSKWAGFCFGLGAATKWWPGLLVVTLLAGPWAPKAETGGSLTRIRVRAEPLLVCLMAWALVQLPAVLVSFRGWADAILFHLGRPANLDSTGAAVAALGSWLKPAAFWEGPFAVVTTVVSLSVLVVGVLYVVSRLSRGRLDPADGSLALVGLFLLTGKVFSPQFVLWLLPVAVVAGVSWWPMAAVEVSNAVVWLLYGPWFAHQGNPAFAPLVSAFQGASVVRTVAVAWLVLAALRWRPRVFVSRPDEARCPSPAGRCRRAAARSR